MTVRFLADEDLNGDIVEALRLNEPSIDVFDVKQSTLRGHEDAEILETAAQQGRIVISHNRRTMTHAFNSRIKNGEPTTGLLIVPQRTNIRDVVESLILIWTASKAEEWEYRVEYLPLR